MNARMNSGLTLPLKSLLPLASVWSKTTLNTGGVSGAGADPQTLKMETFFSYFLGTLCAKFHQILTN